jgi:hypothetical protein
MSSAFTEPSDQEFISFKRGRLSLPAVQRGERAP